MSRSSFDRDAIKAEIDRIRSLGVDALRSLWRATLRASPPPGFTKDLIARFLGWHIQEQAFGGLDPKTAKHLASFTRGARPPDNCQTPLAAPEASRITLLTTGARNSLILSRSMSQKL